MSVTPSQPQSLKVGQALVRGQISNVRKVQFQDGPRWLHVLVLPAPDEYSSPQRVEFSSRDKYGNKGDTVSVTVAIGGRGRSYVDKNTEETIQTADVRLTAVEG